jgi:hypothetical protein
MVRDVHMMLILPLNNMWATDPSTSPFGIRRKAYQSKRPGSRGT